jgi:hypothetical protein
MSLNDNKLAMMNKKERKKENEHFTMPNCICEREKVFLSFFHFNDVIFSPFFFTVLTTFMIPILHLIQKKIRKLDDEMLRSRNLFCKHFSFGLIVVGN